MIECVILFRNTQNGKVGFVCENDGENIAVYKNRDAAIDGVPDVPILRAFPYQIIELDEL